jgi:hypothetical protein
MFIVTLESTIPTTVCMTTGEPDALRARVRELITGIRPASQRL